MRMTRAAVPGEMARAIQIFPSEARPDGAMPQREYCIIDLYDESGHWIDSIAREGDCDSVALDLRTIAQALAERQVPIMVIRHGHPSGLAEPSPNDISATRALAMLGRLIGVHLHDHVIEAGEARFSFRAAGLL